MSIVLELTPEEEQKLIIAAEIQQIDVTSYVREKISPVPEIVRFLNKEAARAVSEAQGELMRLGIGYVTGDETTVTHHLPETSEKECLAS